MWAHGGVEGSLLFATAYLFVSLAPVGIVHDRPASHTSQRNWGEGEGSFLVNGLCLSSGFAQSLVVRCLFPLLMMSHIGMSFPLRTIHVQSGLSVMVGCPVLEQEDSRDTCATKVRGVRSS